MPIFEMWFTFMGVPLPIISNLESQFSFSFQRIFQEELGTQVDFSTTFYPQKDGQLEYTILVLENMLLICVLDFGGQWSQILPLTVLAYNNCFYLIIQLTLFQTLYGKRCRYQVFLFVTFEVRSCGIDSLYDPLDRFQMI